MYKTVIPVFSFIALGAAASTTVSLFIPDADPQSLVGSIAGSDSTATTYVVQCANTAAASSAAATTGGAAASATADDSGLGGLDQNDGCGFPSAVTIVQGPSTVHYSLAVEDATVSINCALMGTTQAICTESATGSILTANSLPAQATATLSASDITFMPVVITAGSATGTASGAATTSSGTKSSSTGKSTSGTGTATGTGTSTSATTQSTNGAMQGSAVRGAGIIGALGVAVAGAML